MAGLFFSLLTGHSCAIVTKVTKYESVPGYLSYKLFYMKKNLGNTDRIFRLILAAILGVLYFSGTISGTIGIILLVVAVVMVLTSLVSFCPFYALVGLNSCPVKK